MIRQILESWKENCGNLLVLLGLLAGLLMSLIWHFELVPEVGLMARGIPGPLVSATPRHNSNALVAIVRNPARSSTTSNTISKSGESLRAFVEVYLPYDSPPHLVAPLLVQSITLRDDGVPVAVLFSDLQPGRYTAVAYIDVNGSGRFDTYEAEGGAIDEPFCVAQSIRPARIDGAGDEASGSEKIDSGAGDANGEKLPSHDASSGAPGAAVEPLPPGIFEVIAGQATLVVLDFGEQVGS